MKILLVGNYAPDRQESMIRFADMLLRGVLDAGHEVRLLRPAPRLANSGTFPFGSKWLGYVDKFILFIPELWAASKWADLVHICDHSNALYLHFVARTPNLITCHDVLAIRSARSERGMPPTQWTGRVFQFLISRSLRVADHIVCVSQATLQDVQRLKIAANDQMSMVYNGLNYAFEPLSLKNAAEVLDAIGIDLRLPFILHVGGNQWYKNRLGVLRIFERVRRADIHKDLRLVMAGKPFTDEMRSFVAEHLLQSAVTERTDVSASALQALYSTAKAMLFPSLQEGFGWPIVEAQACGCKVVTSDRAPMNEIGGQPAIYTDPQNVEDAAAAVELALLTSGERRESNVLNASRFSGNCMIDAYTSLYRKLVGRAANLAETTASLLI